MEVKHISTRGYVIVWLLLMALTLASFLLSLAHLGAADTVAALVIATAKTALVLLFFMHLVEQRAATSLVLVVVAFLLVLFLSLMVADVITRRTFPRGPVPVELPG
jgi:cytochrome c oxidase subunit IV